MADSLTLVPGKVTHTHTHTHFTQALPFAAKNLHSSCECQKRKEKGEARRERQGDSFRLTAFSSEQIKFE